MFGKPHTPGGNAPGRIGGSIQRLLVALMLLTSFGVGVGVDRFSGDRADAHRPSPMRRTTEFSSKPGI